MTTETNAPAAGTTAPAAGTTAPATGTTAPATGGTTAPSTPWHGYTEPADVAYVTNKGWKGPQDAIKSAREAEKFIGRDPSTLLSIPRADDPNGFLGVMDKLGRPADATKYEFAKPEGASLDEGYVNWARGTFHKLGLTAGQVKQLSAEHNAYVKNVVEQRTKEYNLSVETDKKALLSEWRDGHERKMSAAESAAKALGFTGDMIDAIEQTIGYAGTWKFFADLGTKMGEDGFVTKDGGKPGFNTGLTPAEAKAQWETLKVDATWKAAAADPMHPGHREAKEKQNKLFAIMYPQ
jgi:hypothetical protein